VSLAHLELVSRFIYAAVDFSHVSGTSKNAYNDKNIPYNIYVYKYTVKIL